MLEQGALQDLAEGATCHQMLGHVKAPQRYEEKEKGAFVLLVL
jgi:hypothetical protein